MSAKKDVKKGSECLSFKEFRPYANNVIDDPLEELLNEFADLEDEMEDDYEQMHAGIYNLEEILNGHEMSSDGDVDTLDYVDEQLDILRESTRRMKFYLDEIQSFIPRK